MGYIDISITDTNGNTKTLPGINKDYVSEDLENITLRVC